MQPPLWRLQRCAVYGTRSLADLRLKGALPKRRTRATQSLICPTMHQSFRKLANLRTSVLRSDYRGRDADCSAITGNSYFWRTAGVAGGVLSFVYPYATGTGGSAKNCMVSH